jgi:hypothetical protein
MFYLIPIIPILLGILAGYFLTLPILVFLSVAAVAFMMLCNAGEGKNDPFGYIAVFLGLLFLISLWLTVVICLDWLPSFITNFRAFR